MIIKQQNKIFVYPDATKIKFKTNVIKNSRGTVLLLIELQIATLQLYQSLTDYSAYFQSNLIVY